MSSSFKLTNVIADTQPVPFSGVLNTGLYSIKFEGLICSTQLHDPAVSLFGNFFFILYFSAPVIVIKRYSYLAAPDILHCQAPLGESETLHL